MGVPWNSTSLKGNAIDKTTKKPILGVKVEILVPDSLKETIKPIPEWKVQTDKEGKFKLLEPFVINQKIPITVNDIDGNENGSYQSDTLSVDFSNPECEGCDKGWSQGELTKIIWVLKNGVFSLFSQ